MRGGIAVDPVPSEVRRAISILWLSLALSTVSTIFDWIEIPEKDIRHDPMLIGLFAAFTFVQALLIHLTARRRNWARILLLVNVVAVAASYFFIEADFDLLQWTGIGAFLLLDGIAMVLLFTRPSRAWYRDVRTG